jgi:transposase-like protein
VETLSDNNNEILTRSQIEAAEEILVMRQTGKSFRDIAKQVGIVERTLRKWRQLPAFKEYLRDRAIEVATESRAEILEKLTEMANKGNLKAIDIYFRVTGSYPAEKHELHAIQREDRSNEAIREDINELRKILREVEKGEIIDVPATEIDELIGD